MGKKIELLAPAGTVAVFEKAVKEGADAIYIGAPSLNARAKGPEFTRDEIASMINFAHRNNIKVYVAMNSLCKEEEIPQAVETLAMLAELKSDSIIIQDLGIYHVARAFFPEIPLHASTLMGANNSIAVRQFEHMGFSKVVLARELTIVEIAKIRKKTNIDLEVFIHGALCFSYSGLCLFSSYLGGKSGLRGRCVQPCRRQYSFKNLKDRRKNRKSRLAGSNSKDGGYIFSMNDLSGIALLPQLLEAGVSSFKIEGRLRSTQYVGMVVRAYRLAIDALQSSLSSFESVRNEAEQMLNSAMSRKTSAGYFITANPNEIISPYHSGNIGLFLGKILRIERNNKARLLLKHPVKTGDRLRLHQNRSGERFSFSLKKIMCGVEILNKASTGEEILITIPQNFQKGDSIYKVDTVKRRAEEKLQKINLTDGLDKQKKFKIKKRVKKTLRELTIQHSLNKNIKQEKTRSRRLVKALSIWLKTDDLRILKHRLPFNPEKLLIMFDPITLKQFNQSKRYLQKIEKKIVWALPAIIHEDKIEFYKKNISKLMSSGFSDWQISHIGQKQLFPKPDRVTFYGNYSLNILNSRSLPFLHKSGFKYAQISIEADELILRHIIHQSKISNNTVKLGVTVYGSPPLFTSRVVDGHFKYGRILLSPKGEEILLNKKFGTTTAIATKPFSLLPYLPILKTIGIAYAVVDISNMKLNEKQMIELGRQISGSGRTWRLSAFNFSGQLH